MEAYHDLEWGTPLHGDRPLFELLTLEGAQAGLSWLTILRRRGGYRRAFANFEPEAVAAFTNADVDRDLLTRIRMEYVEMPDLRLTSRQASRLWNLDQPSCDAILGVLIRDQFLCQTGDGSYVIAAASRQFLSDRPRARRVD